MKPRSRRPAGGARLVATGLSVSGTVGLVVAMGAAHGSSGAGEPLGANEVATSVADTAQSETDPQGSGTTDVVVIELHRTVYVDEHGNVLGNESPVSATGSAGSGQAVTSSLTPRTTSRSSRPAGTKPGAATPPTTQTPPTTTTLPTTTTAPPPRCSGSECP